MPFLALTCFDAYGLRGCLLILTAVVFHGVPMAATLRPPRYSEGRFEEDNGNREDDAKDGVFEPLQPHCSSTADSANQTRNEIFPSDSTDLSTNILKQPVRHGFDQDVVSDCEIDPLKSSSYEMDSANQPESEGITVDADFMSPRSNEPNETRNLLHSAYNLIGFLYNMFGSYRVVFRILGISLAGICMVILIYIFVDSVRSKKRTRSRLERE
nr:uncharacterized protein LOC129262004 [Lytechinus pictus]